MNKTWNIVYYAATILLSFSMVWGGYYDFSQQPPVLEALAHLGYPAYFALIIGAAKILGVIGIWQTKVRFLREWAYAGFVFDTFGAVLSHLAVGDSAAQFAPALISLIITLVSYVALHRRMITVRK